MITIDSIQCNGVVRCASDGVCVVICPVNAISVEGEQPVLDTERCNECKICIMNCPRQAIHF